MQKWMNEWFLTVWHPLESNPNNETYVCGVERLKPLFSLSSLFCTSTPCTCDRPPVSLGCFIGQADACRKSGLTQSARRLANFLPLQQFPSRGAPPSVDVSHHSPRPNSIDFYSLWPFATAHWLEQGAIHTFSCFGSELDFGFLLMFICVRFDLYVSRGCARYNGG